MKKNEWKWVGVVGRMLLAYALVFAQGALAGQDPKAKEKPDTLQKTAVQQADEKLSSSADRGESRTTGRGSHEGVKVHGHWAIEVRNPDGRVVSHREFENALAVDGATIIAGLLSRSVSAGFWEVALFNVGGTQPCFNGNAVCTIYEAGLGNLSSAFPTLSVSLGTGANGATVILSGTATAGANSAINQVGSLMFDCSNSTAPSAPCNITNLMRVPGQASFNITAAQVNPPIPVSTGQTIAVTVIISFS